MQSLGYDDEAGIEATAQEYLSSGGITVDKEFPFLFSSKGKLPSIGIGQMRPNTAIELESAGYVYVPRSSDGKWTNIEPLEFGGDSTLELLLQPRPYARVVDRLADPVWAIEYIAANMDYARGRPGFTPPPDQMPGKELVSEWEKMAGWHNRGVVNFHYVNKDERELVWTDLKLSYLAGTWEAMKRIERFDLLGTRSSCYGSCGKAPPEMLIAPY